MIKMPLTFSEKDFSNQEDRGQGEPSPCIQNVLTRSNHEMASLTLVFAIHSSKVVGFWQSLITRLRS